jgi:hypothetical protein
MRTPVVPTIEGLVETASLRRAEARSKKRMKDEEEQRINRAKELDALREKFADDFSDECVTVLMPRLKFDYYSWPNTVSQSPAAEFEFVRSPQRVRFLIWLNSLKDWQLTWFDKTGLSHDDDIASSSLKSTNKWTELDRTESLTKKIETACAEYAALAAKTEKDLEEARTEEALTKRGRWRVETCRPEALQHVLNTMQDDGHMEVKHIFPPLATDDCNPQYRIVAWKKSVGPEPSR